MAIERKDIENAARLARLELREEELETFTSQLKDIVGYVDKLRLLNVDEDEPMIHAAGTARLRDDVPGETLPRAKAMAQAPDAQDGFFVVPPIIEGGAAS